MTPTRTDKIDMLLELTRGAPNVYALRSVRNSDLEQYWRPVWAPLSPSVVAHHLTGHLEIGNYALVPDPSGMPRCWWIAADFDGKKPGTNWQLDVMRATQFLLSSGANVAVNLSRSAKGAHIRVLFKEPVPAWLARRWMMAWLEEAEVALKDPDDWDERPPSFDLLVPRQDVLPTIVLDHGHPNPGNLVGAPLNAKRLRMHGGTTPLDVDAAAEGHFEPDGRHWKHVRRALDGRAWGYAELMQALKDAPGDVDVVPPDRGRYFDRDGKLRLPVLSGGSAEARFMVDWCKFFEYMRERGEQPYHLWVAMASQLHAFGEAGRELWHELSALDARYDSEVVEDKWQKTATMHPVRCDTLVSWGFRCPHLGDARCATSVPANLPRASRCEMI